MIDRPASSREPAGGEGDIRAAELALGLLSGAELAAAEAERRRNPVFAATVSDWEERFGAMDEGFAPEVPPSRIKSQIDAELFVEERQSPLARLWASAMLWRAVAAVALCAAGAALLIRGEPQVQTRYIAALVSQDGTLRVVGEYDPARGVIRFELADGGPRAGRTLQLWAATDGPPSSLGLLPPGGVIELPLPEGFPALGDTLHFAVSDEPPGGSPTGAPTGEVLAVTYPVPL